MRESKLTIHLINQLKFTRAEFKKGFLGVSEEDGSRRFLPINSIGWIVGHLAWHEQYYWLTRAQACTPFPELIEKVGFNQPVSTPSLNEMIQCWEEITAACDPYLDALIVGDLENHLEVNGRNLPFNIGTMITRVIYHYWYHNGEMQSIRQMLGHKNLPDFVSDDIETTGRFYLN